jgi:acetyl-CoA carboxylase carboxyltransferase component
MVPAAGGGVYSPAITDFIFMTQGTSQMYITGPDVVRAVTHEEVTHEDLGGAGVHSTRTGIAHFACEGDEECLQESAAWSPSSPPTWKTRPSEPGPPRRCEDPPALSRRTPRSDAPRIFRS